MAFSDFKYGDFKFQQLSTDKKSYLETDFSNKKVAGVPDIAYNLGVDTFFNYGLYATINYHYRGPTYLVSNNEILPRDHRVDNTNNDAQTKPFGLLNAKIGFKKHM